MDSPSVLARTWGFFRRPALSFALRVVISGLLLAYLVRLSAFEGVAAAFSRIQPIYLIGYFLLYFASVSLQSIRWKYLLRAWDVEAKVQVLFRRIMTGLFLNNFLPGSLGGDVYRLYAGGRDSGKVQAVAATIFYERLLGYGSLVSVGLIVLASRGNVAEDWPFWLVLGAALLGVLVLASLPSVPWFERVAQGLAERYAFARKLNLISWLSNFRARATSRAGLAGCVALSFGIMFMDVLSFNVVAAAMQLPVKLGDLLLFVPLLYLAILLPISFNGIGVRETIFVVFSARWGITAAAAVAFSLTVFALNLAGSLVGGLIYWFDRPVPNKGVANGSSLE